MVYHIIKRLFDFIVALFLSVITLPLFIIIGILIKIAPQGAVFFVHKRVGKNGKP